MIEYLDYKNITKEFATHIVAFSVSVIGAMGNSGEIIVVTDDKQRFRFEICDDRAEDNLRKVHKAFNACVVFLQGRRKKLPEGWEYIDLGAGNSLFMLKWLYVSIGEKINKDLDESSFYSMWIEKTIEVLDMMGNKKIILKCEENYRVGFHIEPKNAERKNIMGKGCIRENLNVEWEREQKRNEKIVVIGINPSTAHNGKSDTTITKLCRFLDMYGFNELTMLNLYESVTPKQSHINNKTKTDFNDKRDILKEANIILIAWGVLGGNKDVDAAKKEAMSVLLEYADKLYCIKNPKGRYPVHPSRMPYKSEIMPVVTVRDFEMCGLK